MTWIDMLMMTISVGASTALIVIIVIFLFLYHKHVLNPLMEQSKTQVKNDHTKDQP
ncbi:hypothetical protein UFOVP190_335 [uncultured Caudovirales phage]|uniref:Uncharacterized protein n=1 Tax=uncultured Caudovirales phage TaxID=2100421 RepID=A0A6J7WL11_9CAUD|nr:hypothetical protein UFOVP190_335 [uncultured Caudovirales phage]